MQLDVFGKISITYDLRARRAAFGLLATLVIIQALQIFEQFSTFDTFKLRYVFILFFAVVILS